MFTLIISLVVKYSSVLLEGGDADLRVNNTS